MSNIVLPGLNGQSPAPYDAGQEGTVEYVAKPMLVCDLDGTIRYNKDDPDGFINEPGEIAFYDGVVEALWLYRDEGWVPVVVSNQAGVAHGHMGKKDLDRQMNRMQSLAAEEDPHGRGWPFLDVRLCMYDDRADDPMYGLRSLNRKPSYGALAGIENRAKSNGIIPRWDDSVMIGDREEDAKMAEAAGLQFWPAEGWRESIQEELLDENGDSTAGEIPSSGGGANE